MGLFQRPAEKSGRLLKKVQMLGGEGATTEAYTAYAAGRSD
jgi:hypothetical protein